MNTKTLAAYKYISDNSLQIIILLLAGGAIYLIHPFAPEGVMLIFLLGWLALILTLPRGRG